MKSKEYKSIRVVTCPSCKSMQEYGQPCTICKLPLDKEFVVDTGTGLTLVIKED